MLCGTHVPLLWLWLVHGLCSNWVIWPSSVSFALCMVLMLLIVCSTEPLPTPMATCLLHGLSCWASQAPTQACHMGGWVWLHVVWLQHGNKIPTNYGQNCWCTTLFDMVLSSTYCISCKCMSAIGSATYTACFAFRRLQFKPNILDNYCSLAAHHCNFSGCTFCPPLCILPHP